MKIQHYSSYLNFKRINNQEPKQATLNLHNNEITKPINVQFELPSFHSIGRSIAFKGNDDGKNVRNIKQKIQEAKDAINVLKNSDKLEPSESVKEAKKKLEDYDNWQARKNSVWNEASQKAEEARQKNKRWYGSYGVRARDAVMESMYYSKDRLYDLDREHIDMYTKLIKLHEDSVDKDQASKDAQIKVLEEKIKELETNMSYATLYDAVNSSLNSEGGIEDRIAGYRSVKNEIERTFVNPLISSKNDPTVKVPPAIMLYGATGCGKTTFLEAIREQTKDVADVIDLSDELDSEETAFQNRIDRFLRDAKLRYQSTGKRTIFLINEAEQYFCMDKEDIDNSGMFLTPSDLKMIETYNENSKPASNVYYFKSLFDVMSKIPTEDDPRGCASSVFITTNYPHLIHRDLLSRDGRHGKLAKIAVKPAADEDLRDVMKFYFKKYSDLIETIKMYSKKDNYEDYIKSIPYVSNQGKDVLISKVKDGTIVNMHIDPTCSEFKNFDQFIKGNNPSLIRGAYSNARILKIADDAFANYLENPTISYEKHFCNVKNQYGVDINSKAYRYFNNIYEMVENPEKFNMKNETISEQVMETKQAYLDGELSKEDIIIFKQQINDIKAYYDALKNKEDKSELENKIILQYKEFLDATDDIDL